MTIIEQAERAQRACNLGVRFTWKVSKDHQHPEYTFTCVEDPAMAALVAMSADAGAPAGLRVVGLATSPSSGRNHPWEQLEWTAAGDRTLVKRGAWIYLPTPPAGWFLITAVFPRFDDDMRPITRVIVNGRGAAYVVDFFPGDTVAIRFSHPEI